MYLQAFAPITSTETRLIPFDGSPTKEWDNKRYEDQLFYFNTRARPAVYEHGVQGAGLDHCYDCMSEVAILTQWIVKQEPDLSGARLNERVAEESLRISRSLDTQRTLESGNADPGLRRAGIVQRQSIEGRPAFRVHTEARGFAVSEAVAVTANASEKRGSTHSLPLPPAKAQRTPESCHAHAGAGAGVVSDGDANSRDCSANASSAAVDLASHRDRVHCAPTSPTGALDMHQNHPNHPNHPNHDMQPQCSSSGQTGDAVDEEGVSQQLHQPQYADDLRTHDYRAQSSARFDVDKYSKMLGVSASAAASSNYAITSGTAIGSTRGLGFAAAAAAPTNANRGRSEQQPRERLAAQPSRPSNAHIFPEIASFRRWLSVYSYSRIMEGPNRFLDLSLRPLCEVVDAVTYCKPSVYIHGHVNCSVGSGAVVAPAAKEQEDVMQRFPSVTFRGFALNFSGKDGGAELSHLCSSCRIIAQIDVVDVGLLVAQVVTSEAALIAVLDSFNSVCARSSVMQGRTDCSIHDFTRFARFYF